MVFESIYPAQKIPDVTIVDYLFADVPDYDPHKPLFTDALTGQSLSWTTLKDSVFKLAHGLAELGLRKGDMTLILSHNNLEFPMVLLAVNLLGGIVSTCNPAYTNQEIQHQLKDSGAKFLFTIGELAMKMKEVIHGTKVQKIISIGQCLSTDIVQFYSLLHNAGNPPRHRANPRKDVAILPYSSGTTGLPKGVMLSNTNLVANIIQTESGLKGSSSHVMLAILPFFHIFAINGIFYGIKKGCTTVVLPKFDPIHYLESIQKYRATFLTVAPPVALFLAKHPIVDKYDLSSLQEMLCGAAPLSSELEEEIRARLKVGILQGYGMTELSPCSTVRDSVGPPGSCGLLVCNTKAKIVSLTTGKEVKRPEEEGELLISGPNVMLGYWNNPEQTKQTMTEDGYLKTGDVAKRDKNGYFFITDRAKELIKVKGFQVSPAELEGFLLSHPAVADVAVIGIQDERAGELPKAFVVLKESYKKKNVNELVDELDQFVNQRFASYKRLEKRIQFVDSIPKSAAGKILRRILRDNPPPIAKL
eukprot:TRINITY_DN2196_c0_g1_i1.p1 TRINITY_DN2196_c0_g1~~TRINITY_DN2196_c0_g1_i1.p1  ORF type:complete len:531 (+),score=129.71 TRINITY_DN2196_c0_g1_i1:45-1637(+)